uniref:Glutathione transferase-like protein n=1 Tax=Sparassis latifolia TaxID=1202976 RepID=A0A2U8JGS1_9APHY|nr:glutathione transferase-like protein [Sparassis latifolia]
MSEVIIFYDIPSRDVKDIAWSPNTWKTRFSLNYKGLPYKTVWVEYPDIARVCREIGAQPTSTSEDGSPYYTLPAIYDPSTKTAISESEKIARYLDKAYPDTPVLIPSGTCALHAAFQEVFLMTVQRRMQPLMLPPTNNILNPPSEAYFRRTRESKFGKLEDWSPPGPIREKHQEDLRVELTKVAVWMASDGEGKPFFMGDTIHYADITIAGWLVWMKKVLGPESQEWTRLKTWDDGKWGTFMQAFEKYEIVG